MYFFISDLHFGSEKMLEYRKEEFKTMDQMDDAMIEAWNSVVSDRDSVVIVGDFSDYGSYKTISILKRLKGRKHLIIGKNDEFIKDSSIRNSGEFVTIGETLNFKDKNTGKWFYCSHYPMLSWPGKDKGTIHVFGALHSFDIQDPDFYRSDNDRTNEEFTCRECERDVNPYGFTVGIKPDLIPSYFTIKSSFDVFADRTDYVPVSAAELCRKQRKKEYQKLSLKYLNLGGYDVK